MTIRARHAHAFLFLFLFVSLLHALPLTARAHQSPGVDVLHGDRVLVHDPSSSETSQPFASGDNDYDDDDDDPWRDDPAVILAASSSASTTGTISASTTGTTPDSDGATADSQSTDNHHAAHVHDIASADPLPLPLRPLPTQSPHYHSPLLTAARRGDLDSIRKSLVHAHAHDRSSLPYILDTARTRHGYTILHVAAKYGHVHVLQWLLGDDTVVKGYVLPLLNRRVSMRGWSVLHVAAVYDRVEVVRFLLQDATRDSDGITREDGIRKDGTRKDGTRKDAQSTTRKGGDDHAIIDLTDADNRTPFQNAIHYHAFNAAFLLAAHSTGTGTGTHAVVSPNRIIRPTGMTILHESAMRGDLAAVQFLVEQVPAVRAMVDGVDAYGARSALVLAAIGGHARVVEFLLWGAANDDDDYGGDIGNYDMGTRNPVDVMQAMREAKRRRHTEVQRVLRDYVHEQKVHARKEAAHAKMIERTRKRKHIGRVHWSRRKALDVVHEEEEELIAMKEDDPRELVKEDQDPEELDDTRQQHPNPQERRHLLRRWKEALHRWYARVMDKWNSWWAKRRSRTWSNGYAKTE